MIAQKFINALEAWLVDEVAGKERLVVGLERQENALVNGTAEEIGAATRAIEAEISQELDRSRRREVIFARLGAHWNVAPVALTLGSIAERAGQSGARIEELRDRLRLLVAESLRRNRRVARLVHVHQSVVQETLTALVGSQGAMTETGALFDARM
ncbi:MAG: flagellar export chaperone FlgN [Planctomycetota bacterium]|nr:flagellar export chaperone FlgN [Planctomycetota bacterium]